MFCVGLLLCTVAFCVYSVTGLDPTPGTIPEILKFQCISNHTDVDVVDIQIDDNLTSSTYICDEGNSCRGVIDQPNTLTKAKLKQCPKDKPITIAVAMSSGINVCGGSETGYFKLYCLTGTNMSIVDNRTVVVRRTGSASASTPKPKEEYEVVDLDMTLYKNFLSDLTDSTVTIGTTLYVLIKSPNRIKLGVGNCTAYGIGTKDNLMLLDSSGHYTDGNRNGVLLETFSRNHSSAQGCVESTCFVSKLHAFHFKNSMDVSLECYINVCPDGCKTSRRRRRSPNSDQRILRVSMRVGDDLHVADIEGRSSGKAVGVPHIMTTALAALFAFIGYI